MEIEYCITRDEDGELKLQEKTDIYPFKVEPDNFWVGNHIRLDPDMFPEIRWGDEPKQVKINVTISVPTDQIQEEQPSEIPQISGDVDQESDTESN